MYPAGRQMLPVVAFQRRMRPSFPADDKTVLVYQISKNESLKGESGGTYPVMFHSTLDTADLVKFCKHAEHY